MNTEFNEHDESIENITDSEKVDSTSQLLLIAGILIITVVLLGYKYSIVQKEEKEQVKEVVSYQQVMDSTGEINRLKDETININNKQKYLIRTNDLSYDYSSFIKKYPEKEVTLDQGDCITLSYKTYKSVHYIVSIEECVPTGYDDQLLDLITTENLNVKPFNGNEFVYTQDTELNNLDTHLTSSFEMKEYNSNFFEGKLIVAIQGKIVKSKFYVSRVWFGSKNSDIEKKIEGFRKEYQDLTKQQKVQLENIKQNIKLGSVELNDTILTDLKLSQYIGMSGTETLLAVQELYNDQLSQVIEEYHSFFEILPTLHNKK